MKQPDFNYLIEKTGIKFPLIGFYDIPDTSLFEPVVAPFGSGCMQLVSHFKNLNIPQAIIGSTDMVMRKYVPQNMLAFTVTKPLFEQLCSLGEDSYLGKRFFRELQKARKEQ